MKSKSILSCFNWTLLILLSLTSPRSWAQFSESSKSNFQLVEEAAQKPNKDPLLIQAQVLPFDWNPGQNGKVEIKMTLPESYHAYEEKFALTVLEPDGFKIGPIQLNPITEWFDTFSKKKRRGMKAAATLSAQIEAPNRFLIRHDKIKFELTYQACSEQFCLFPTTKTIEVPISTPLIEGSSKLENPSSTSGEIPSAGLWSQFSDTSSFINYISTNIFAGLLFVFFAGVFTSFTPCIFPMIPITLAILGNHSEEKSRLQNFLTSLVYVLGIATTYSVLGLVAASGGSVFGANLGNPYVLSVICIIFLTMSLSMYGLFDLQMPAFIRNHLSNKKHGEGWGQVFLTGLFAGIVASPCVGPVLVAILTHVASTQNKLLGFFFLFTYALGLGLIFIVLGLSNQLAKSLPRSGPWMIAFKFILGSLMLSAFYYYLSMLLPERGFDILFGIGLVILASVYGAFMPVKGRGPASMIQKGLMQALLIIGIGYLCISVFDLRPYLRGRIMADHSLNQIQMMNWQEYSPQALAEAAENKKPVIIDFWAEWCAACHELEEQTFTDPRVRAVGANYSLLKFDATKNSDALKELKKKYNIQGLPTLIFINKNGEWIDALTLTQFEKAASFVSRLEKGLK